MPNSTSAVVRPLLARRRGLVALVKGFAGMLSRRTDAQSRQSVKSPVVQSSVVEAMEERQLLSAVYVSASSGNDHSNGHSASSAVKTLARAKNIVQNGDTLYLKAGDTWNEAIGSWTRHDTTITSYGSGARPRIRTAADALDLWRTPNVTVRNLSFQSTSAATSHIGIKLLGKNDNVTIDNVEVTGFRVNVTAEGFFGDIHNLTISNSQLTYSNGGGMSHGLFATQVKGLTLTNDLFDHNGGHSSMMNHGAYITALCSNLVATGNTFSNSSSYGMQARCGGIITNNTFSNNSVDLSVGYVNGAGVNMDGGVTCTVTNNLFTGSPIGKNKVGYGLQVGNIKAGVIAGNKFINGSHLKYAYAISLQRGNAKGKQVGINNLKITNNVAQNWGWRSGVVHIDRNAGVHSLSVSSNSLR